LDLSTCLSEEIPPAFLILAKRSPDIDAPVELGIGFGPDELPGVINPLASLFWVSSTCLSDEIPPAFLIEAKRSFLALPEDGAVGGGGGGGAAEPVTGLVGGGGGGAGLKVVAWVVGLGGGGGTAIEDCVDCLGGWTGVLFTGFLWTGGGGAGALCGFFLWGGGGGGAFFVWFDLLDGGGGGAGLFFGGGGGGLFSNYIYVILIIPFIIDN